MVLREKLRARFVFEIQFLKPKIQGKNSTSDITAFIGKTEKKEKYISACFSKKWQYFEKGMDSILLGGRGIWMP